MEIKYPLEYEIDPEKIEKGNHWIIVKLKNIGKQDLKYVQVQINSLESSCILVEGLAKSIHEIKQNETEEIPFEVTGFKTGDISISMSAYPSVPGQAYYWESSPIELVVGKEIADLKSLLILSHPHTTVGESLEVEAIVQGVNQSEGLRLEFWSQTPSNNTIELNKIEIGKLLPDEEIRRLAILNVEETGFYTVHAYLYNNDGKLDYKSASILVK